MPSYHIVLVDSEQGEQGAMIHVREACAVGVALLLLGVAYYTASESGWLHVYGDDVADMIGLVGGAMWASVALCQLVKGVLS
jgi:hypothetical protein